MPVEDLEQRFPTFFQAFWIKPRRRSTSRQMTFRGAAEAFSAVIREALHGLPLTHFETRLVNGVAVIDLMQWTPDEQMIVIDLFGDAGEAQQYFDESAGGWTPAEQAIVDNPALVSMIPDVSFAPQERIREVRHLCVPSDPASVELMNAQLRVEYQRFAQYDGQVIPDVTTPGLGGTLIGAPGVPPEWVPP